MLGAIAGDVIGSAYEGSGLKRYDFELFTPRSRFTDDTVLTVAVARVLLEGGGYAETMRALGRRYPDAGYGGTFRRWLRDPAMGPYGSWGNGAAMRVAPIGWLGGSVEWVLAEARASAVVSHDHPEGIRGAQAVALAVHLARAGGGKAVIRAEIEGRFGYDLGRAVASIRPGYGFDVSCQGSVPESICCFLEAEDFEAAVRNAVSLGGDADTMACIAGAIAEAHWGGVPERIARQARARLPADLLEVTERFAARVEGSGTAGSGAGAGTS